MGTGWDVTHAALFLASVEASFITGVTLPVDGGASATATENPCSYGPAVYLSVVTFS
jgi:enoyl-[acyl-carrier-protein] reductase (NADH)